MGNSESDISLQEQIHTMLKKLTADFDAHRSEARDAMQKVARIDNVLATVGGAVGNLNQLPLINQNLSELKSGLLDQNKFLVAQNGVLIQPATRTQNALTSIIVICLVSLCIAVIVVLIRNSHTQVEVTRDGVKIKNSPEVAATE